MLDIKSRVARRPLEIQGDTPFLLDTVLPGTNRCSVLQGIIRDGAVSVAVPDRLDQSVSRSRRWSGAGFLGITGEHVEESPSILLYECKCK